ncbi:hypothetical protein L202_05739 [Cryptococcus amylolentus CBS 6039]|uniref:Thioredoxin domain-containing protein n=1 Tax=Cryptococcus amylolentus CBS 6039 TaxID=1295533 RepID=A0A1E3HP49_9TREE|nr:hypothetical protein L202_05739 [Cryptococcus amylolentus CBS 6039]ODN77221.1 hypothetical protein L202_05739 [Cryptococcus amylolentus CBS 6039]
MSLRLPFTSRAARAIKPTAFAPAIRSALPRLPPTKPAQYRMTSVLSSAANTAHSAFASLASVAQTKPGDTVPNVDIKIDSPEGKLNLSSLTGKNVVVTVPGAFSGVCTNQIPSYIAQYDAFRAKGVKDIYVVAVNDIFVVNAWKDKLEEGKASGIKYAADDSAKLAASLGLVLDAVPVFGGPRLKRGALIIEDGKVQHVAVEDSPGDITVSHADSVLKAL